MGYTLTKARGLLYLLLRVAINRGMVSVASTRVHTAVAGTLLVPYRHRGVRYYFVRLTARTHGRSQYSTLAVWQRGVKEYSVQLKAHAHGRSHYSTLAVQQRGVSILSLRLFGVERACVQLRPTQALQAEEESRRWDGVRVGTLSAAVAASLLRSTPSCLGCGP